MTDDTEKQAVEKFFCNNCKGKTNHTICAEHETNDYDNRSGTGLAQRFLVAECRGCEHVSLIKKTHFSEHYDHYQDPSTGQEFRKELWDEVIYPPVTYRASPPWFGDLPDSTLQEIFKEIYKSLEIESHYLATFGSRTLIDRLIVLTVGDKGNFQKGMKALIDEGKLSEHEHEILKPVLEAGHAAAHRAWAPSKEMLTTILDTVENLIHRLLVLPKLTEELDEAVPTRGQSGKAKPAKRVLTTKGKIEAAPKDLRAVYDALASHLEGLGDDISINPQKHYIAFRRNRNFASVQIYNQKRLIRIYLNLDPDEVDIDDTFMRDVRQIGHFGTGDLEITIKAKRDIEKVAALIEASYEAS